MSDYVSRQAAIDAIGERIRCGAVVDQSGLELAYDTIKDLPSADVVSVVRCKDCIYLQKSVLDRYYCLRHEGCAAPKPDGFCNYGKRREE